MQSITFSKVLIYSFTLLAITSQTPFIFDDAITSCMYSILDQPKKPIEISSKVFTIESDPIQMYFKFCGKFDTNEYCPVGTSACMENHRTKEKVILAKSFTLEKDDIFKSNSGSRCTEGNSTKTYSLVIYLRQSNIQPSYMKSEGNCIHHVEIRHPSFSSNCGSSLHGVYLDLSPLARQYKVQTPDRNFSITLCGSDRFCGGDASACEIMGNAVTNISTYSSLYTNYEGDKNQLSFHGVTHQGPKNKIDKRFDVVLKCSWDKNSVENSDMTYVKKRQQGSTYSFELKTSYGCVKISKPCVVHDQFFVYNLSNLFVKHPEVWQVNGTNNNRFYLQMCGSAHLRGKNNSCKSTYAQVCENVNGLDINRGSILSHLEVTGDSLTATINSGMRCKINETDTLYQTIIDFYCDWNEHGPKFVKYEKCDTHFEWKTPDACPNYNASSCIYIHKEFHDCIFHTHDNYSYNLNALNATQIIKDQEQNLEFKFNICGPVLDQDAPCMKDVSVAMKNLSQSNIKYRVTSLGKFYDSSVKNGSLVLSFNTGAFCSGSDYRSEIHLQCSDTEEKPIVIKRQDCFYEFLWKTKYGCPQSKKESTIILKESREVKNCSFVDYRSNERIDLAYVGPMEVVGKKYKSIFHICDRSYLNCSLSEDECPSYSFSKSLTTASTNVTTIEVNLPNKCLSSGDFNKVNFQIICDLNKTKNHVGSWKNVGCDLTIQYFTNGMCSSQGSYTSAEYSPKPSEAVKEKELQEIEYFPKENPVEKVIDCSLKSPFTNHALNLHNFSEAFFKNQCPNVTFNETFSFVKLLYASNDVCRLVPTKNISYEVYLVCSNDISISPANGECLQHLKNDQQVKYCDLFKTQTTTNVAAIIGSVFGVAILIIALLLIGLSLRRRNMCCSEQLLNYRTFGVYERDSQSNVENVSVSYKND